MRKCKCKTNNNCSSLVDKKGNLKLYHHEGEDYCLVHKPEKNDIESEDFFDLIKEKATEFPKEHASLKLISTKIVFENDLNCFSYVFPRYNNFFLGAVFEGYVNLVGATFEGRNSFKGSIFKNTAEFSGSVFEDGADFQNATFEGIANFCNTHFLVRSNVNFPINFMYATFENHVSFDSALFNEHTTFWYSSFNKIAVFSSSTFNKSTTFKHTLFLGGANFEKVSFKDKVSFKGVTSDRLCSFVDSQFHGSLTFDNADYRQGVIMERLDRPEKDKYYLFSAEQEGCRIQRLSYDKEGKRESADSTFVREMRAKRKSRFQEKSFLAKLLGHIHNIFEFIFVDLITLYGTSWERIILSSFFVISFFAVLYWFFGCIYLIGESPVESFWKLLYFSITTFSTLGYGDMYPVGGMRFIAGIQSLIGAFFVALFVVVFARKWMR